MPPADGDQGRLMRELDLTRALLRQARADRDRLQRSAIAAGNRVVELEDVAMRALQRERANWGGPLRRALRRYRDRRAATRAAAPVAEPADAQPAPPSGTLPPGPALHVDVSVLRDPARSGIARVTVRLAQELAAVTDVRLVTTTGDRLVRDPSFDGEVFGGPGPDADCAGAPVTGGPGVWVFSAAIQREAELRAWQREIDRIRAEGGQYAQVVHDLLPLNLPDFFDLGMRTRFPLWLDHVARSADVLFADSHATAGDLVRWAAAQRRSLDPQVVPLGCDPRPDRGDDVARESRPLLLMVGVVEPRKAVDVVVDAVQALRDQGHDIALALVGRRGWVAADVLARLEALSESADWFTWDEEADDQALDSWYRRSHLLVAASRGEGYGLPAVEAVACGLPVLARDIPVFHEVLGDDGAYFDVDAHLPDAILAALQERRRPTRTPPSWQDTAGTVARALHLPPSLPPVVTLKTTRVAPLLRQRA